MTRQTYNRHELSSDAYHASDGISSTHLKTLHQYSPYFYKHLWPIITRQQPKDALVMGSFIHAMVLEPETVESEYVRVPNIRRGTKEWKQFEQDNENKILIKEDDWLLAEVMRKSFESESIARELRDSSDIEQSVYWDDEETGEQLKVRADMHCDDVVCDLKTVADMDRFIQQVETYGYDLQGGHYCEGLNGELFILMAVEKTAPYRFRVFELSPAKLNEGRAKFRSALNTLHDCKANNVWPSDHTGVITL